MKKHDKKILKQLLIQGIGEIQNAIKHKPRQNE